MQDSQLDFTYHGQRSRAAACARTITSPILYATVDGQPANALPRDAVWQCHPQPDQRYAPAGTEPRPGRARSWAQASIRSTSPPTGAGIAGRWRDLPSVPAISLIPTIVRSASRSFTAAISALAAARHRAALRLVAAAPRSAAVWERLGDAGQIAISVITSLALMIGMLLTWGDAVPNLFRREPVQLGLAILTAGLIYVQPHFVVDC